MAARGVSLGLIGSHTRKRQCEGQSQPVGIGLMRQRERGDGKVLH